MPTYARVRRRPRGTGGPYRHPEALWSLRSYDAGDGMPPGDLRENAQIVMDSREE